MKMLSLILVVNFVEFVYESFIGKLDVFIVLVK